MKVQILINNLLSTAINYLADNFPEIVDVLKSNLND